MFNLDQFVFSIIPNIESGFIQKSFSVASFIFDPIPFLIICFLTFVFIRSQISKKEASFFAITIIVSVVSVWVLKMIFDIERPNGSILVFGPSFPSAHATIAVSYFLFILHISKRDKNIYRRWVHFLFCILFPVFVGVSRLYFGVHWLSDVLFGYILGAIIFFFTVKFFKKYENRIK